MLLLRSLLRFDPAVPDGRIWLAPELPPELSDLRLENVPLAGGRIAMSVGESKVDVTGLPPGVVVISEPRPLSGETAEIR
jgi:hypothetical protein